MHYRRPHRKSARNYFTPLLVVLILMGGIYFGWKIFNNQTISWNKSVQSEKVFLSIESGSAEAMMSSSIEWQNAPDRIDLFEGEKIRTNDGMISLEFFEGSQLRLDKNSELHFEKLEKSAETFTVGSNLVKGLAWANIKRINNPGSKFYVETPMLKVSSRGGLIAFEAPGKVYVLEGSANIDLILEEEVIKSFDIGVGQEFRINKELAQDLKDGKEAEVLFALSDEFKSSDWYLVNIAKDKGEPIPDAAEDDSAENSEDPSSNEDTVAADNAEKDESESDDTTPPAAPKVVSPDSNATITKSEQMISGTVSKDTAAVIVNDYRLTQYVPGSGKFQYFAKASFKNLKEGVNEYKIIAEDKAGNKSNVTTFVMNYEPEEEEADTTDTEEKTEDSNTSTDSDDSATSNAETLGSLDITKPNSGNDLTTSETSISITGKVPSNTSFIEVNGYRLTQFKKGDSTFLYKASVELGNLKEGQENIFTAKALDEDEKVISSDEIKITLEASEKTTDDNESKPDEKTEESSPEKTEEVEKKDESGPVILTPSTSEVYETTLDTMVLSGSVGNAAVQIFVNDELVTGYAAGDSTWKKQINLKEGGNTFTVRAQSADKLLGIDTIVINYTP